VVVVAITYPPPTAVVLQGAAPPAHNPQRNEQAVNK